MKRPGLLAGLRRGEQLHVVGQVRSLFPHPHSNADESWRPISASVKPMSGSFSGPGSAPTAPGPPPRSPAHRRRNPWPVHLAQDQRQQQPQDLMLHTNRQMRHYNCADSQRRGNRSSLSTKGLSSSPRSASWPAGSTGPPSTRNEGEAAGRHGRVPEGPVRRLQDRQRAWCCVGAAGQHMWRPRARLGSFSHFGDAVPSAVSRAADPEEPAADPKLAGRRVPACVDPDLRVFGPPSCSRRRTGLPAAAEGTLRRSRQPVLRRPSGTGRRHGSRRCLRPDPNRLRAQSCWRRGGQAGTGCS